MNRLVPCCLLLFIVAVWGWAFALMKEPVAVYGVVSFLAVRFVIGSAVIGVFSARRITRRALKTGGLIGTVLGAAYLLQTFGLRHSTATNTGMITGLFILFAPLANRALLGVRTPPALWLAVAVSVLGLGLLTGAGPAGLALGDALTLGCAACFGLHMALLDRYAKHHDASALAFGQLMAATVIFLAIWPLVETPAWPSPKVWFALLVTGIVATAAAFYVQTFVQQRMSAVQTGVIIILEPLFAALFAYLLVGDRLTCIQIVGAALMISALVIGQAYPLLRKARARSSKDA